MSHFIKKCSCGTVVAQCRCPDPNKRVEIVTCCECIEKDRVAEEEKKASASEWVKCHAYIHSSKDSMCELGGEIGMADDAFGMFRHALAELKVVMNVNTKTGHYKILEISESPSEKFVPEKK